MVLRLQSCCHRARGSGWSVVAPVLLPLVVSPVARVVVGGAAAVPAGVRPRLDVHVHHVRLEGVRAHEALPAVGAPEKGGMAWNFPYPKHVGSISDLKVH